MPYLSEHDGPSASKSAAFKAICPSVGNMRASDKRDCDAKLDNSNLLFSIAVNTPDGQDRSGKSLEDTVTYPSMSISLSDAC